MKIKNRFFVLMSRAAFDERIKNERTWANQKGYKAGYSTGLAKGKERHQKTPGWLRDEVHRKLDLMFKKDEFSDRARYRWLKQHSLTTSHMSQMSKDELLKINKILDETISSSTQ